MPDSVQPQRQQPTWLRRPRDSPGKNSGVGCHFLLQCMKAKSKSEIAQSCPTPSNPLEQTPWTAAHQAPLSMGLSRQEYWSGVPLPIHGIKRLPTEWQKIFASHISDKVLVSRLYREPLKLNNKKTNPIQNGQTTLINILIYFSKENMQMANKQKDTQND